MTHSPLIIKAASEENISAVIKKCNKRSKPGADNIVWRYVVANKNSFIKKISARILDYSPSILEQKIVCGRKIVVPTIEERILQLAIVVVLKKEYFPTSIFKNVRIVKGERSLNRYFLEYTIKNGNFVAYADVSKYADNLSHKTLTAFLKKYITETETVELVLKILDLNQKEKGIFVGYPLVSFLLDMLLIEVDYKLSDTFKNIIRFHDDYFYFSRLKSNCEDFIDNIGKILYTLELCLNHTKSKIIASPRNYNDFYE